MQVEQKDLPTFEVISNDGSIISMKKLIDLKTILSRQLPKMPKEYIVRLLFDSKHESIVIKDEKDQIFGGVCYCVFKTVKLAEIVFLAISADRQVRGYGTSLMNHLKTRMQKQDISFLMTCADNLAIGYFKKQGFHNDILMPKELWKGYLKDYEGSTLMECLLDPDVDYMKIGEFISVFKQKLILMIRKKYEDNTVQKGISEGEWEEATNSKSHNKYGTILNLDKLTVLKKAGFDYAEFEQILKIPEGTSFQNSCLKILEQLVAHKASWPFQVPVKKEEVPDYFEVIKDPIDFRTIRERLLQGHYTNKKLFVADVNRIFTNARTYNVKNTIYYKYANELESYANEILVNLKDETSFQEKEKEDKESGSSEEVHPNTKPNGTKMKKKAKRVKNK
jgi:histone acetyltransferase